MKVHMPPVLYSVDLVECRLLPTLRAEDVAATFAIVLRRAGATVVKSVSHVFPGSGLTCVLILSESHAVIHTWPETGTVHLDIFSCSSRLRSLEAVEELSRLFGGCPVAIQEIQRVDGHGPEPDPIPQPTQGMARAVVGARGARRSAPTSSR